jgi:uncharacterized protein DUF6416
MQCFLIPYASLAGRQEVIVITVTVAQGVELHMEDDVAESLLAQLKSTLGGDTPGGMLVSRDPEAVTIRDDHPLWEQHSGLQGHRGREWDQSDTAEAEAFYLATGGKAKIFLDLLIDHPGELLDVERICALRPDTFSGSRSIAGALNGLYRAHQASGRRYPFYWWAGSPSRYAMKPSVARLFGRVGNGFQ